MPEEYKMRDFMVDYLLEDMRKKAGKSYDDIAASVYGEPLAQARMRLYRLRKPKKDGTRKELSLDDFIKICRALSLDPVRVMAVALEKTE